MNLMFSNYATCYMLLVHTSSPRNFPCAESSENRATTKEAMDHDQHEDANAKELGSSKHQYRQFIFGEEALKISPMAPYTLRRPIRRGHLNISQHYPMQQVHSHFLLVSSMRYKNSLHLGFDYIVSWFAFDS